MKSKACSYLDKSYIPGDPLTETEFNCLKRGDLIYLDGMCYKPHNGLYIVERSRGEVKEITDGIYKWRCNYIKFRFRIYKAVEL